MEQILSILQWLLPSGGLGLLLGWITSRRLRASRTSREEHDTYKVMYDNLSGELKKLSDDYISLHGRFIRLERAVLRINSCPHARTCPIVNELRKSQAGGITDIRRLLRTHEPAGEDAREHRKPALGDGKDGDTTDEPYPRYPANRQGMGSE